MHRFALAGFGSIAENGHLPALRAFDEIEVTAVADVSEERLERARAVLPHAELYASAERMIAESGADSIDICAPPAAHADLMVAACRQGMQTVLCEKPFVLTADDYRRVAAARARSGSRVVSVNNWIHSDLFTAVRRVLDAGAIGRLRSIVLRTARPNAARGNEGWQPGWRTDLSHSGGGIILDHGWHQLYLVMGWVGEPIAGVRASTAHVRQLAVEDEATIDIHFPSVSARIELAWTAGDRRNDGEIVGSAGKVAIHDDRIVVHNGHSECEVPFAGRLTQSSYHPEWFRQIVRCAVLDDDRREADRNFAEAGNLVATIEAIYRSARLQGEVRRPETLAG